jgi:hypothetical protein
MQLTAEQIEALTGYKRPSRQCRALAESGINYLRRADGRPATTWEAVNAALAPAQKRADDVKLNLDWMRK